MARLPPNHPSKRRSRTRGGRNDIVTDTGLSNENNPSSFNPSNSSRGRTECIPALNESVSSTPPTTVELETDRTPIRSSDPNLPRGSISSISTPTGSPNATPAPLIPRRQENTVRSRCLAPLNLAATTNRSDSSEGHDFIASVQEFFTRQEQFNALLEKKLSERLEKENEQYTSQIRRKRLPKEVSANVRDVYASLTGPDGQEIHWDLSKGFSDPRNAPVNASIIDGVRSTDTTTPANIIRAAMRVHFRTKKRRAKNIANKLEERVLKEQRVRSRKNGKRLKRCNALKQSSTIAEPDKARYLPCMKNEYMSSEESMTDDSDNSDQGDSDSDVDAPKPRVLCIRPLPWRSRELNDLMSSLDRKVTRRRTQRSASMTLRRRLGANSTRPAPENAPEFALS